MIVRKYADPDEQEWLRCRVISFLDCSYWNDVKKSKEKYDNPCVSLVAEESGTIVGLIDIEIDSRDLVCKNNGKSAIVWHLAVLPEYRRLGIAKKLWECAKKELMQKDIGYCELWTQDDIATNVFYQNAGDNCKKLLDERSIGDIYGPEELIFHASLSRKSDLIKICYRINEVRLYTCLF